MLGIFVALAAVASIPTWLEERRKRQEVETTAVREVDHPRDLLLGGARLSKGPANAPFTLVEFTDFCCPDCAVSAPILAELARRHPRDLRVVFRHFPLEQHPTAHMAAYAAEAAAAQGKFWEMHDLLLSKSGEKYEDQLAEYARRLGLHIERFQERMLSSAARAPVARDIAEARRLLVVTTPTYFFLTPRRIVRIIGGEYLERFLDDPANWK